MFTKKGGRTQLNARGSTRNLTSLIDRLTLECKTMIKIFWVLQTAKFNVKNMAFMLLHDFLKGPRVGLILDPVRILSILNKIM